MNIQQALTTLSDADDKRMAGMARMFHGYLAITARCDREDMIRLVGEGVAVPMWEGAEKLFSGHPGKVHAIAAVQVARAMNMQYWMKRGASPKDLDAFEDAVERLMQMTLN